MSVHMSTDISTDAWLICRSRCRSLCRSRCVGWASVSMWADVSTDAWPICWAIHWPLIIGGISVECRWSIGQLSYNISQKFKLSCSVRCIIVTSTQVAARYRRSLGSLLINMSTDTWPIYRLRCVGQRIGRVSVEISADMSTHTSRSTHQPRVGQSICQLTYRLRGAQTTHDPSFVGCVCFFFSPQWSSILFSFHFRRGSKAPLKLDLASASSASTLSILERWVYNVKVCMKVTPLLVKGNKTVSWLFVWHLDHQDKRFLRQYCSFVIRSSILTLKGLWELKSWN